LCGFKNWRWHTCLFFESTLVDSLRTDGDICHQGWDTKIAQKVNCQNLLTQPFIHWKALEKHFLMHGAICCSIQLVFLGKKSFSSKFC
jgi:hypothetical protein